MPTSTSSVRRGSASSRSSTTRLLWRATERFSAFQQAIAMGIGLYLTGLLGRQADLIFYLGFGAVLVLLALLHPAGLAPPALGGRRLAAIAFVAVGDWEFNRHESERKGGHRLQVPATQARSL